jgi:hypothetical protein
MKLALIVSFDWKVDTVTYSDFFLLNEGRGSRLANESTHCRNVNVFLFDCGNLIG